MTFRRPMLSTVALATTLVLIGPGTAANADSPKPAAIERTAAPEGASVYFISPENGSVVTSPVTVRFGLRGMGVAPAGVDQPNTGHHHLVIDAPLPDLDLPIPTTDHYRHFGGGQTELQLTLPPGKHTLQLVLGDFRHVPYDPPIVSERIEITVK